MFSTVYLKVVNFLIFFPNRYVMSPPIRAAGHSQALQAALSTGVLQVHNSPWNKLVVELFIDAIMFTSLFC